MLLRSVFVANTMVQHGITAGEHDYLTMPAQLPIQGQSRLLLESRQERKQPIVPKHRLTRFRRYLQEGGDRWHQIS